VPWGRRAHEYEAIFELPSDARKLRVLDCGGGPASFAAEWSERGHFVVAADPIYAHSGARIAAGFEPTAQRMLEGMHRAKDRFVWTRYESPEAVIELRRDALTRFARDFDSPARCARYASAALPRMPFRTSSFDLVLCSHMLFLYSDDLDLDMHCASLRELLRVGSEVRVFPLLDMQGRVSSHLEPALEALRSEARCEVIPTAFEFQRGGGQLLRLTRGSSD